MNNFFGGEFVKSFIYVGKDTAYCEKFCTMLSEFNSFRHIGCISDPLEVFDVINSKSPDYIIVDLFYENTYENILESICDSGESEKIIVVSTRRNLNNRHYHMAYKVRYFLYLEDDLREIAKYLSTIIYDKKETVSYNKRDSLTNREYEVLKLIALGKTSKEIADSLFISKNTVDTHRNKMLQKLKLTNSSALISYAFKSGLI